MSEDTTHQNLQPKKAESEEVDEVNKVQMHEIWPTVGGINMEDLYSKVLYGFLHSGKTLEEPSEFNELINCLQKVFCYDNLQHHKMFQLAWENKNCAFLNLVLNMEIVQVKGLRRKQLNGVCNPFCVLFIKPSQKFHTTIKVQTEGSIFWREYFSFPVTDWSEETLHIEVWDHVNDLVEMCTEKKTTNGLQFLKEQLVFLKTSTEMTNRVFLGSVEIPLQDVSTEGLDKCFPLQVIKDNYECQNNGDIHLRISLDAERDWKVAAQEYRQLLHMFLVSELHEASVKPYVWNGQFHNKNFEHMLQNFQLQCKLTQKDEDLAKYMVYTRVHSFHPLHTILFPPTLQNILQYIQDTALSPHEIGIFWFASEKLVANFLISLREKLKEYLFGDSLVVTQIYYMLRTFQFLTKYLNACEEVETTLSGNGIIEKTENIIVTGARELLQKGLGDSTMDDNPAENVMRLGQLIIEALLKGRETLQDIFKQMLGVEYFDVTYFFYDTEYCEVLRPIVEELCRRQKPLEFRDEEKLGESENSKNQIHISTILLKLYLTTKKIADLSCHLSCADTGLCIKPHFHHWFRPSVAHWLHLSCSKAMKHIKNAVRLDNLTPVDQTVHFSSSAVDTATILHQIRMDWSMLAWPEVEASYLFISTILNDLCRCTIFYMEQLWATVDDCKETKCMAYQVSDEVCIAINSIQRVCCELNVIKTKLKLTCFLSELKNEKEVKKAEGCEKTLIEPLLANITENINNKIFELLENIGHKLRRVTCRYLLEAFEDLSEEHGIKKLIKYLDINLIRLKQKLTDAALFVKMLSIIWENVLSDLSEIMENIIKRRRPPRFFEKLCNIFQVLTEFFNPDGIEWTVHESSMNSKVCKIREMMELHDAPTMDLILKYYQDRYKKQSMAESSDLGLGMLALRTLYSQVEQTLWIEILNAQKLTPRHVDGFCDSYVRIQIIDKNLLHSTPTFKTKVHKRTLFPLFEQSFSIKVDADVLKGKGVIEFCVMDHDLLGRNKLLGECFILCSSIPFSSNTTKLLDLQQILLPLAVPQEDDMDLIFHVLDSRQEDKDASHFVRKWRLKLNNNNSSK